MYETQIIFFAAGISFNRIMQKVLDSSIFGSHHKYYLHGNIIKMKKI